MKKTSPKKKKEKIQNLLDQAINLQIQKNFIASEDLLQQILTLNPNHAGAYHYLALIAKDFNDLKTACSLMLTSTQLDDNNAEAHYNYAVILDELTLHTLAITSYKHAVAINQGMSIAWFNLANAYFKVHQNNQVSYALEKLLATNFLTMPNYHTDFYSIIANLYLNIGNLDASEKFCLLSIKLHPENQDALWTLLHVHQYRHIPYTLLAEISSYLRQPLTPLFSMRMTIHKAIEEWQLGQFKACQQSIEHSKQWDDDFEPTSGNQSLLSYRTLIQALLTHIKNTPVNNTSDQNIYMVGDSHTLSNTHQILHINQQDYQAHSRLCIGCKTFHLTQSDHNNFKTSFNYAIDSIPDSSPVIFMLGEIDCRATEGILPAFLKGDNDLSMMIQEQVEAYIAYALQQTNKKNLDVYFYGVPAPKILVKVSDQVMELLKNIIYLFNQALQFHALQNGCKFIDIYQFTVGENGLSDGCYHIDDSHLLPKCIEAANLLFISNDGTPNHSKLREQ